ncbi:hypothetical protein M1403_00490 [Patescibacteria group bacterium]|nr:hypothetical protein [Patescibacteria group bacterium]
MAKHLTAEIPATSKVFLDPVSGLKIPVREDPEEKPATAVDLAIRFGHGITPGTIARYGQMLDSEVETVKITRFKGRKIYNYDARLYSASDVVEIRRLMFEDAATVRCHSNSVRSFAQSCGIHVFELMSRVPKEKKENKKERLTKRKRRHSIRNT